MSQGGPRSGRLGPEFTPGHMAVLSATLSNLKACSPCRRLPVGSESSSKLGGVCDSSGSRWEVKVWEWVRSLERVRKAGKSLGQAGKQAGRSMQGEVDRQAQPAGELGALSNTVLCWPDKRGRHLFRRKRGQGSRVRDGYKQGTQEGVPALLASLSGLWRLHRSVEADRRDWAPKAQVSVRGFLPRELGLLPFSLWVTVEYSYGWAPEAQTRLWAQGFAATGRVCVGTPRGIRSLSGDPGNACSEPGLPPSLSLCWPVTSSVPVAPEPSCLCIGSLTSRSAPPSRSRLTSIVRKAPFILQRNKCLSLCLNTFLPGLLYVFIFRKVSKNLLVLTAAKIYLGE